MPERYQVAIASSPHQVHPLDAMDFDDATEAVAAAVALARGAGGKFVVWDARGGVVAELHGAEVEWRRKCAPLPRLRDFDPLALARKTARAAMRHLSRYATLLEPAAALRIKETDDLVNSPLGGAVARLVRYAQSGDFGDWPDREALLDSIALVRAALFAQPRTAGAREERGEAWWQRPHEGTPDPETEIGIVLLAAEGRDCIERQYRLVEVREAAALAGLSTVRMRRKADAEGLFARGGPGLDPGKTAAWLASREVPGFQRT